MRKVLPMETASCSKQHPRIRWFYADLEECPLCIMIKMLTELYEERERELKGG